MVPNSPSSPGQQMMGECGPIEGLASFNIKKSYCYPTANLRCFSCNSVARVTLNSVLATVLSFPPWKDV